MAMKLNRSHIVEAVAARVRLRRALVREVVDAFLSEIERGLVAGCEVRLSGFGSFVVRVRGARPGRNLRSGEAILQAAQRVPAFRSSELLRKRIANAPTGEYVDAPK